MSVNLNSLSLAEKIKIQQQIQQQGLPQKSISGSPNKADMNTSIWPQQPNHAPVQANKTNTIGGIQHKQVVSAGQKGAKPFNPVGGSGNQTNYQGAIYENPKNLNSLQDITKAKTMLYTRMAKEGSNYKLEQLDMQLDARRAELSGTNDTDDSSQSPSGMSPAQALKQAATALVSGKANLNKGQSRLDATNSNTGDARSISADAKNKQTTLNKDVKTLQNSVKKDTKSMQTTATQIETLSAKMMSDRQEIDGLMSELADLTAGDNTGIGKSSAFSLSLAGENTVPVDDNDGKQVRRHSQNDSGGQNSGVSDDLSSKVSDIQQRIMQKSGQMKSTSNQLNRLVLQNNKRAKTVSKNIKTQQRNFAATNSVLKQNKTKGDKIINFGQKTVTVGDIVHKAGSATETIGKGLEVVGGIMAAYPATAAAAPGVIKAGTTVSKIGNTVGVVGSGVSAAGNITETAGNIANGDTGAALSAAAGAIKSGVSIAGGIKATDKIAKAGEEALSSAMDKAEATLIESMKDMVEKSMSKGLG